MPTQLHNLNKGTQARPKKRRGRGNASGKGTYSSRGIKGQNARSGGSHGLKKRSLMRQFIKKTPKIGGFRSIRADKKATVTLRTLDTYFSDGDMVSLKTLKDKKIISPKIRYVKIVDTGKLTKKVQVEGCSLSESVKKHLNIKVHESQ